MMCDVMLGRCVCGGHLCEGRELRQQVEVGVMAVHAADRRASGGARGENALCLICICVYQLY